MELMDLERFLSSSRARQVAIGLAVSVVAGICLMSFLPAWIQLDDDASATVVAAVDPAWGSAANGIVVDTELDRAGGNTFASEARSNDNIVEIDEAWLAREGIHGRESDVEQLACIIEPYDSVEIGSPVTGLIKKIHVEWSDFVVEGQVLVELESSAEVAAVRLARAQSEMNEEIKSREETALMMERRRVRLTQLYEQNAVSLDLREEVETDAKIARFELRQARDDKRLAALQLDHAVALLQRRTIRSPLSGVVVERMLSEGERVEDEAILTIAQIDPLRVDVILPSSAFGSVAVGMRAAVVPEYPSDSVHVAPVTIVDRVIDAASGTFGVQLELPNPDYDIPVGLHCQVRFLNE